MKRAYYFLIFALLGLIACETEPQETTQGTLYIYADNTEIYANGEDAVTFNSKGQGGCCIGGCIHLLCRYSRGYGSALTRGA